jgi:hypothetical protein
LLTDRRHMHTPVTYALPKTRAERGCEIFAAEY